MTDKTRRWFADSTIPYALAVLRLFEHAHASKADYVFGPLEVAAMADEGLTVSGSEAAVAQADRHPVQPPAPETARRAGHVRAPPLAQPLPALLAGERVR